MAPRGKKTGPTEKEKDAAKDVQETEDPLQAVVLADSFETRFTPFTLERPRCLLPLANTPLIEYTLEFLANSGVEEVYVYCGAHADQLEEYLQHSKWLRQSSPFKLEILRSTSRSTGDAMRDLDKRGILSNDFIVVYGDIVSNLNLDAALAEHRARRILNKEAIMTMVLREAGARHRIEAQGTAPVFVIDPVKKRCLHYEQMSPKKEPRHVEIDPDLLWKHEELELRHDLIDCGIDICTPDVLALWSDNFDYQAPRKGFLHSVLKDYELNGKTIHTHIVQDHYAARVCNLKAYDSVSKEIISRWTYPMSPDSNLQEDQNYRSYKGNVFKEDNVELARSSVIGPSTVIGRGTSIGEGSRIKGSVIGRHCSIGRNCIIEGAYIWDGTTIDDGSEISHSIVGSGAVLGKGCKISGGALISYRVKLVDGTVVQTRRRITRAKRKRADAELAKVQISDEISGHDLKLSESEDDDTKAGLLGAIHTIADVSLSTDSISTLDSDTSDDEPVQRSGSIAGSFISQASDESQNTNRTAETFHQDATSSIFDSLQKGHDVSTIQLELQGLRMSANATDHQLRRAVATAFMRYIADARKSGVSTQNVLSKNKMVLERTIFDKDADEKTDQVDFLLLAQTELAKKSDGEMVLRSVCHELYMLDVLEEVGLQQWWNDGRSSATVEKKLVRGKTGELLKKLAELDSESEDEEENEEDGDISPCKRGKAACVYITPPITRKRKVAELNIESTPPAEQQPPEKVAGKERDLDSSVLARVAGEDTRRTTELSHQVTSNQSTEADSHRPIRKKLTRPKKISKKADTDNKLRDSAGADGDVPSLNIIAPQTPVSTLMDSDDDLNSVASSDAFGMEAAEDSDISLPGGDSEDEFGELDVEFDMHAKEDLRPKKTSYEVDFKVYSPADIQSYQDKQIEEVAMIIGQPPEASAILLRHARWNKERLIESYMDKQEKVLEDAGLGRSPNSIPKITIVRNFTCEICCEDSPGLSTFAMRCGHRYCVDCYRHYLSQKITEEAEAAKIRCPGDGCNRIVDTKSLDLLIDDSLKDRYQELLTRTYVDDKDNLKWCPAPNCEYVVSCAIKQKDLQRIVPTVKCNCGHSFCFGCSVTDHQPTPCSLVKKWVKKCEDDSETANWISANTKECPKCVSTIEKNGGCNHMTCRKCKHEFCWICMGGWSEHGTSWYNCNRFEEKSGHDARDAQAKSRQSLERYLHYYNRFANHEHSAKLDKDIALKAEKKMISLQSSSGLTWIEVQFISHASKCLQECRQTLKWTYAFAYYLARNNHTVIFEDNQKDLEMAVENLSEMFEKGTELLAGLRIEMMDKINYCTKRRKIVLTTTADELLTGSWEFIGDASK